MENEAIEPSSNSTQLEGKKKLIKCIDSQIRIIQ